MKIKHIFVVLFCIGIFPLVAQNLDEEDYSMYDDFDHVDENAAKAYAPVKINGLSPAKFVYFAWDAQSAYQMNFSDLEGYAPKSDWEPIESAQLNYTGGLRFNANIPVISKNTMIWSVGVNYMETEFSFKANPTHPVLSELNQNSLKTAGVYSTLYKPLNENHFLLFQLQGDYNGNYTFTRSHNISLSKYSWAALWGKRPSDYLQWGVGLSRTYRVGALNYIPIVLYNWTSVNEKWGAEVLFPARAHGRYSFDKRNLILFGYELEGASYHLMGLSSTNKSIELRRGEIRPRLEWQKQLIGYFWLNAQAGARINYSFIVDELPDRKEFLRGFFGEQEIKALSSLTTPFYGLIGINFVSP